MPPVNSIRRVSWVVLVLAGLVQAWYFRHMVFSDGISYLDIATYYAKGDWHSALNSYWSPLYSWILAIVMVITRPDRYWDVGLLHLINFCSYLASIAALELLLGALFRFRDDQQKSTGLSETTVRLGAYASFLLASLLMITMGYNSPDMLAMALMFLIFYLLLLVESGKGTIRTYLLLGMVLGLQYLCRAAFLPFIGLFLFIEGVLLRRRGMSIVRPVLLTLLAAFAIFSPFVTALSFSEKRFTLGDAGKLNYGWEVNGAARSIHWQGEPYNIGKPEHPTHQVLKSPGTYVFPSPVPGSYPPWYEPSYWYAGIRPHFSAAVELRVFLGSLIGLAYLLLRSPVTLPVLVLAVLGGWRRWFSKDGIFAYWFLLVPSALYILGYCLVYLDPRYVAGSLVVVWICMLASISLPKRIMQASNRVLSLLAALCILLVLVGRLRQPAVVALSDISHRHEGEWNLNWQLATQLENMGLRPSDKVAFIGQAIDAEWARLAGVRIVAEVPVAWKRGSTLFRGVVDDRSQVDTFWMASKDLKSEVFRAFRNAGATVVVLDRMPSDVDQSGWTRVLPADTPHMTAGVAQRDLYKTLYFRRIAPAPAATPNN